MCRFFADNRRFGHDFGQTFGEHHFAFGIGYGHDIVRCLVRHIPKTEFPVMLEQRFFCRIAHERGDSSIEGAGHER